MLRLRPAAFEEVEHDISSLAQAVAVVGVSSAAMTLGTHGRESVGTVATAVAAGVAGWILWSWAAFAIGTTLLREGQTEADWGQLLRTTGFATAPGLVAFFGIVRPFAGIAVFVGAIWTVAAFFLAVKQALDYRSTVRTAAVCAICWTLHMVILLLLVSTPG